MLHSKKQISKMCHCYNLVPYKTSKEKRRNGGTKMMKGRKERKEEGRKEREGGWKKGEG
jgi:hypothetical protein